MAGKIIQAIASVKVISKELTEESVKSAFKH